MDVTEESTRLPPTNGCDGSSLTRVLVILVNMLKLMPARGTPRTRTGSIRRFRDCTVHGVWASAVVVQLHRTTPRGCHAVASVPLYEAVVILAPGAALRAPLRGCQYPRTRSGAGSGPPTPCSEPLRRTWRRMAPSARFSARAEDSTSGDAAHPR